MSGKTLSPFSFYGGKARFAHEIVEMLDYDHTDVYVEPFGGACRVLLNKPRHVKEIYNDLGTGLVAFFDALSDKTMADKVIRKLNEMEISREVFIEQQRYKNEVEMDIDGYITKQTLALISEFRKKYKNNGKLFNQTRRALNGHEYPTILKLLNEILKTEMSGDDINRMTEYRDLFSQYWEIIEHDYTNNYEYQFLYKRDNDEFDTYTEEELNERFALVMDMIDSDVNTSNKTAGSIKTEGMLLETGRRRFDSARQECINDLLSPQGGLENIIKQAEKQGWHKDIHRIIRDELPENGKVLDGYNIVDLAVATFYTYTLSRDGMGIDYSNKMEMDSKAYYRRVEKLDDVADRMKGVECNELDAFYVVNTHRKNPAVMMYLDPSYLSVEEDKKSDTDSGGRDLGEKVYAASSSIGDHERLLGLLLKQDTKAKIILSNYDVEPYKSGLTEKNGWKRREIETYTSIGGKKDNKRTEVLWYNY